MHLRALIKETPIPKGIEEACRRQASEDPEHRGTM